MSRISKAFENKKAFIAFITGGDPDLETTEALIPRMAEAGADIIEIGVYDIYQSNLCVWNRKVCPKMCRMWN